MIDRRRTTLAAALLVAPLLASALLAHDAGAQTDYYNTDVGRPLQTEDAYAIERRAVEIQAAPLRLERSRNVYAWGIEPELAVGLLPRTQVELGLPLLVIDAGVAGRSAGIAGLDASFLYNLNAETRIPALAVGAGVLAPVGSLARDQAYTSVKGIATRTLPWARFHVNLQYTFGEAGGDVVGAGAAEMARWTTGLAVDRAFPLESLLLSAEVFMQQPLVASEGLEWNAAAGTRVQLAPRLALDLGGGAHLTGADRGWFATVGGAYVIGLPWRAR
jgi:hypothetical protein